MILKIKIYLLRSIGLSIGNFSRQLEKVYKYLQNLAYEMVYTSIIYQEYGD